MHKISLLIFAKPPRMGLSKTRLAEDVGPTQARRIAAFTLASTLSAARASGLDVKVYTTPDRLAGGQKGRAVFRGLDVRPQGGGTLTDRLERGLREAPPGMVLFIGSDAPDISPSLLRAAVRGLMRHDAVFGPALDGGFWLFGMHKGPKTRSPFGRVRWSGPHAMEDVWSHLPEGARVCLLPPLIDIDAAPDWDSWRLSKHKSHRK
jgi:rSAM/selenodomain-associated transferase 1